MTIPNIKALVAAFDDDDDDKWYEMTSAMTDDDMREAMAQLASGVPDDIDDLTPH